MKRITELDLMTSTAKVRKQEQPFIAFDLQNGKKIYKCRAEAKADIDAFIKRFTNPPASNLISLKTAKISVFVEFGNK